MDLVISYYEFLEQNIRTALPSFIAEFVVRAVLFLSVLSMHLEFQPQPRVIAEEEMLSIYKRPKRESYVPPWVMVLSVIILPLLILCLPALVVRNYVETAEALLGWSLSLLMNANFTELLKVLVLRPRPDFFYRCFPCGIGPKQRCVGSVYDIIEGRKSFPSGHTSFAFCSLGFLSLWLDGKLKTACRDLRVVVFCLLPLVLATLIGVSRCYDNHHHWEDVAAEVVSWVLPLHMFATKCIVNRLTMFVNTSKIPQRTSKIILFYPSLMVTR